MKKVISIVSILLVTIPLFSQSIVSIEECQQWAVTLSSASVQKELNEQLLKVKISDASSHLYPSLEIIGTASYISAMPQLQGGEIISKDQYRIGMELYQKLFDGGKVFYNRRYQRLMNKNDINKIDLAINKLKEQVITLYLNLLIVEQQNKIFSNLEKTIDEQLKQLRIMLKEGVIYNSTVAQLEVELLKIQQQKGELLAQKNSLSSSLSILTGKELTDAEFTIPTVDDDPLQSESCRLEYAIFKNEIAGLEFQRKLYYANTSPQISLVGLGGYGRTTFDIFSNDFNWFYFVGITMRVPVINWARTTGVGNIIRLQKSILEAQQFDFEKSNQIEIQEKLNEIKRIEDLLTLDNKITQKYNDLTATYRIQLVNGTITIYDFIRQQNDEIQSLINKEVHTIQLLKAKYELKALKGNL